MLLLTSVSDVLRVISSAAGALDVHASFMDNDAGTITPGRTNTASISTATTTTVVAAPGSGVQRNVKMLTVSNEHGSVVNGVTIEHFDGTTAETVWKGVLEIGEQVVMDAEGRFTVYTAAGAVKGADPAVMFGASSAAQGPAFASDTYLNASYLKFRSGGPKVGTKYKCRFSVSKTAAGTATPIVTVRIGTAGTTGDTARNTFTFAAGTAAVDTAWFEMYIVFRTVGAGSAAVSQGTIVLTHSLATTGFINLQAQVLQVTSAGFDSTVANLGIGVSVNGGTSAAWTVQMVAAEIENN